MPQARGARPSDRAVEAAVGIVLRVGVACAAVLVAAGGVAYLIDDAGTAVHYHTFGAAQTFTDLPAIVCSVLALDPIGIIALGLVVLVLTPVARMVVSLFAFAIQRDYLYVVFSVIVLIVLAIGLSGHVL
jgi:uncharacterized membrane protein